jgi:hypothetical protein
VIDLVDPAAPEVSGSASTPGVAQDVTVGEFHAYVADGAAGLQIIDIRDPLAPFIAGSFDTPGEAQGVAIEGALAYIADGLGGLQIINVARPTVPYFLSSIWLGGETQQVAVQGGLAFVTTSSGLVVVDVTDPVRPEVAGTLSTPDRAQGVVVDGNSAYIAVSESGILVVDVTDPVLPRAIGSSATAGTAARIELFHSYLAVADMLGGLQIRLGQCGANVSVAPADSPAVVPAAGYALAQARPSPFGASDARTEIPFSLPEEAHVTLRIYDATGRLVRVIIDQALPPGDHAAFWNGRDHREEVVVPSVYFYRLDARGPVGHVVRTRSLVRTR